MIAGSMSTSNEDELLDLAFLTEDERRKIEEVMKRSCDETKMEEKRLNNLQAEIDQEQEMMVQHTRESAGRACPLCSVRFGIIVNTGARCPHCFHKICKQCRIPPGAKINFVCSLCDKRRVLRLGRSKMLKYEPPSPTGDDEIYGTRLVLKSLENLERFNREFPQGPLSRIMTLPAKKVKKGGQNVEGRNRPAKKLSTSHLSASDDEKESTTPAVPDKLTQSTAVTTEMPEDATEKVKNLSMEDLKQDTASETMLTSSRRQSMYSQFSEYSGGSVKGDYDISGEILFSIEYFEGKVLVNVKLARGLAAADRNGKADPYVKTYLLPDPSKETKRKTRIVKKNLDPIFNEVLSYEVPSVDVAKKTLWLSVWDWDRFGRNSFLGEVRVPLSELDLSVKMEKWWPLVDTVEPTEEGHHGEIHLSLKAEPMGNSGLWSITVNVKEAQNLPHRKHGGVDSFVKCSILPNSKQCQKTKVVYNTSSPTWSTVFFFEELHPAQLDVASCLEVTVWDKGDKKNRNEFIGGLRIGPSSSTTGGAVKEWLDSTTEESTHWSQMMSSVGMWVTKWHTLRGSMISRLSRVKPKSSLRRHAKTSLTSSIQAGSPSNHKTSNNPGPQVPGGTSSGPDPPGIVVDKVSPLTERKVRGGSSDEATPPPSKGMLRTESMSSFGSFQSTYSGEGGKGDYTITGEVLFGVEFKDGSLLVNVSSARDLAAAGKDHTSYPYVKTYILPDPKKVSKRKTRVVQKSLNPKFNETLKYEVPSVDVAKKTLWLSVWDWDRFGRNSFLGEVRVPLSELDLSVKMEKWWPLKDKDEGSSEENSCGGEISLGLMFEPPSTLHIHPKQGKYLRTANSGKQDKVDAFVKCYLLPDRSSKGKKKTQTIKNNQNPVWMDRISYSDVSLEELSTERVLEVTVWHLHRGSSNEFIGGLRLGTLPGMVKGGVAKEWMDSSVKESTHWQDVLARPGKWVEVLHSLRPTMNPRKSILDSSPSLSKTRKHSPLVSHTRKSSDGSITMKESRHSRESSWESERSSSYVPPPPAEIVRNVSVITEEDNPSITIQNQPTDKSDDSVFKKPPPPSSPPHPQQSKEHSETNLKRVGSVESFTSFYSTVPEKGDYTISGEVLFGVEYSRGKLLIHVNKARDIAAADKSGTSDSYVKTYLLPDKKKETKKKTKVVKKTLYPVYNETLKYEVPSVDVAKKTLWLSVWDWDRFGRNSFLGEVRVPLSELDLSVKMEKWWPLYEKDVGSHSREHTNVPEPNPVLSPTAPSNVPKEETPVISVQTTPTEKPQQHVASIEQETHLEEKIPDDNSSVSVPPSTEHEEKPSPIIVDQPSDSNPTSSHIAEAVADQTDPHITETHNLTTQSPQISVEPSPSVTVTKRPERETPPSDTSPAVTIISSPKPVSNLKRVGSVESFTSFYSTVPEKGDYTISGEVLFGVEYSRGKLLIHVNKARDIAAADKGGTSDSYVKTYLLPDKKKETKKKTKVVKKTLYPVYNETLKYDVPSVDVAKKTLWLSVWDWDRFGRNSFLGEVRVPLSELDLSVKMEKWWPLVDTSSTRVHKLHKALGSHSQNTSDESQKPKDTHLYQASTGELKETPPLSPPSAEVESEPSKYTGEEAPTITRQTPPIVTTPPPSKEGTPSITVDTPPNNEPREAHDREPQQSSRTHKSPELLQTNLKRVGSVESFTSFYSTVPEKGDYTISGEVLFGVEYSRGKLLIHVNKARDIAAADKGGTSDSYVKTYLLPDKKKETKKKTKVVKKTLYPVYNETLKYNVSSVDVAKKTLWLSVWDWDRFGRNSFLGEVRVPLSELDLSVKMEKWWPLVDTSRGK